MGMFDWVAVETDCPTCGTKVGGFQSKSADCSLSVLSPEAVADFYTSCPKCKQWIEFVRYKPLPDAEPAKTRHYTSAEIAALGFHLSENR